MSEPLTTWRPLGEFGESDSRPGRTERAPAGEREAFVDILGFADDNETDFNAPAESVRPVIRGDFAEIEAALLARRRPGASVAEAEDAPPWARLDLHASREDEAAEIAHFPPFSLDVPVASEPPAPLLSAGRDDGLDADLASDELMLFDDAAVSGSAAIADEDKRSRRPIYIMAALVLAGVVGISTTFLRRDNATEAYQALKPVIGPLADAAPAQSVAAPVPAPVGVVASAPAQQASAANAAPAAAPAAAPTVAVASEAATQQAPVQQAPAQQASAQPAPAAAAPAQTATAPVAAAVAATAAATPEPTAADAAARVISLNEPGGAPAAPAALPPAADATASILTPPTPGKAQELAAPSIQSAIDGAKKVKTAAVRPDGSLVDAEAPATKPATAKPVGKQAAAKAAKAARLAHLKTHHGEVASAADSARLRPRTPTRPRSPARPRRSPRRHRSPRSPRSLPRPRRRRRPPRRRPRPRPRQGRSPSSITP